MAFQAQMGASIAKDYANTIIRQKNACPICHLPLCYGFPDLYDPLNPAVDHDSLWYHIQSVMKRDVLNNSNLFGTYADAANAQICHYVGTTMIPEITQLGLYTTPATLRDITPEIGYYLHPEKQRDASTDRFLQWRFLELHSGPRRDVHMHECLNLTGVHYFVACKDCNMAHTGSYQLQAMTKNRLRISTTCADVFCLYTFMFDNMANEFPLGSPPVIKVTEHRKKYWQIELWLNYCMIMFLAQQEKDSISTKKMQLGIDMYTFAYAHRDMGICDFYMNQILSAILFLNYEIDVDFIWLHQNFLSFIPLWAKKRDNPGGGKLFETRGFDYNCMWRLVAGNPRSNDEFCVREDIIGEYFFGAFSPREIAIEMVKSIHHFTETWLLPIGLAITTNDPASLSDHSKSIRELYQRRLSTHHKSMLSIARFVPVGIAPVQKDLEYMTMENPSITLFEEAFMSVFPLQGNKVLYENFALCALSRTTQAFRNADMRGLQYPDIMQKMDLLLHFLGILLN